MVKIVIFVWVLFYKVSVCYGNQVDWCAIILFCILDWSICNVQFHYCTEREWTNLFFMHYSPLQECNKRTLQRYNVKIRAVFLDVAASTGGVCLALPAITVDVNDGQQNQQTKEADAIWAVPSCAGGNFRIPARLQVINNGAGYVWVFSAQESSEPSSHRCNRSIERRKTNLFGNKPVLFFFTSRIAGAPRPLIKFTAEREIQAV